VRYEAEVGGRLRQIAIHREDGRFVATVDGRSWTIDAVRVDARTLSLLITETVRLKADTTTGTEAVRLKADTTTAAGTTFSHEITLAPDAGTDLVNVRVGRVTVPVLLNGRRRSGRKEEGGHAGSGPQRVVAPMPGKIVRVLVKAGEAVRARQPIVVIEAMKMENELRAGRDGLVVELPAADGQSVEAGTLLAVIA
jgi:biotin carboxyl carrier protein